VLHLAAVPRVWLGRLGPAQPDTGTRRPQATAVIIMGPGRNMDKGGSAFLDITGRSPAAQLTVTKYLLAKMRSATGQRAADRLWDARERVTQVLYELGEQHAEPRPDGTVRLPITQGELGDLAGVAVSTVERILKDLRRQGLVATRFREITIRDMAYLSSLRFPQERPEKPLPAVLSTFPCLDEPPVISPSRHGETCCVAVRRLAIW